MALINAQLYYTIMKGFLVSLILIFTLFIAACSDNHQGAEQRLVNARTLLSQQEFAKAKAEIDSINILYPKSFDQRRAGMALLDTIRKAENLFVIASVDSQLVDLEKSLDKLKAEFVLKKDEKYQETGAYVPKQTGTSDVLNYNTLRSGVEEGGQLYLESIYIGGQKHNKVKVTVDSESLESLELQGDGAIHRFSDLGKSYEIMRLAGKYENGLAKFIAENQEKNIKVTLLGSQSTSYTLPKDIKVSIAKSYELSAQMFFIDSLKTEKEKAAYRNFYLDNNKQTEVPIEE